MEKSFREIVEESYAALARGDFDFLIEHADPEIEIVEPPNLPGATTYRGREGFMRAIENCAGQWEEFRIDIERVIESGPDRVIVFAHHSGRGRSSGAVMDLRNVNVHTGRDGKGIRWEIFSTLDEAFAAIGLRRLKGER
jgi:ketosteroid isomerase-like protein